MTRAEEDSGNAGSRFSSVARELKYPDSMAVQRGDQAFPSRA